MFIENKIMFRFLSCLGVPNLAGEEHQARSPLYDQVLEGSVQLELGRRCLVDQRSLCDSSCRGSLLVHNDLGGVDD